MAMAALTSTAIRQRRVGPVSGLRRDSGRAHHSSTRSETAWRGRARGSVAWPPSMRTVAGASICGELARGLELRVLLLVGRDRRAHPLPGRERVAVGLVDAVVGHARLAARERQPGHGQGHGGVGPGHVVVVVVPDHDGQLLSLEAGQRGDVGRAAHAVLHDRLDPGVGAALDGQRAGRPSCRTCGRRSARAGRGRCWPGPGSRRSRAGPRTRRPR